MAIEPVKTEKANNRVEWRSFSPAKAEVLFSSVVQPPIIQTIVT